jgi:dihydroflavonol-4-reductase
MRVLVTGGTGFTGAHTTKALVDAGHEVVLLVRSVEKIDAIVRPLGVGEVGHVVGDMTDRESVARALDGCDAVVHTAALVGLHKKDAEEVLRANPLGAENVLGLAAERGLDPIVHVSSLSAVYHFDAPVLHRDLSLVEPEGAYGRSKVASDRVARRLQDEGVPVVITYPGGIVGPAAGSLVGESNVALVNFVKSGAVLLRDGGWSAIDVRDLAAVHAACVDRRPGPARYLCGGPDLTWPETAAVLRRVTGRRMPVLPISGAAYRGIGRLMDWLGEHTSIESSITEESMRYSSKWVPSDDTPVSTELGIDWRDPATTVADALRSLHRLGVLDTKHLGQLALEERCSN